MHKLFLISILACSFLSTYAFASDDQVTGTVHCLVQAIDHLEVLSEKTAPLGPMFDIETPAGKFVVQGDTEKETSGRFLKDGGVSIIFEKNGIQAAGNPLFIGDSTKNVGILVTCERILK